jgi:hypothetical protein
MFLDQFTAALRGANQVGDDIGRPQQKTDRIGRQRRAAVAQLVEQGLERMSEIDQAAVAESAGAALDGVDGTEGGAQCLGIAAAFVERHEVALEFAQDLIAFLKISLAKLGDLIHGDGSLADLPTHERRKQPQPVEGGDEDIGGPLDAEGQVALLETLGGGEKRLRADGRQSRNLFRIDDDRLLLIRGRQQRFVQIADRRRIEARGQGDAAFRAFYHSP